MKTAIVALALLTLTGCQPPPTAKSEAIPKFIYPVHRFARGTGLSGNDTSVALDTETGQLCRTWDWHYDNSKLNGGLDTLPLCLNIYYIYPTANGTSK